MKNHIMLITYPDSLGGNLFKLNQFLDTYYKDEIGSIHILPFYPSSGDRGFAPITYTEVDPQFGTWDDIQSLAENHELMFDFMINHLSRRSPEFQSFIENHENSPFADMFLRFSKFWPGGFPTQEQIDAINKRKPCAPAETVEFCDGTKEDIWCTFSPEQMDLNIKSEITWDYIERTLKWLTDHGASCIRLDAFAFSTKSPGTSCFFLEPEVWGILERVRNILNEKNACLLPEIHDSYKLQMNIAQHGYMVYDFVLPLMVLHTLYSKSSARIQHWLTICPRSQQTTLDTHDGMGVVDVEGLLSEEEIQEIIRKTEQNGCSFKWDYRGGTDRQKRVYQIDGTYYSALGENEQAYLLARAIQFFTPGIPQIYYVGLLCGTNDYAKARKTGNPRDIGRHDYSEEEMKQAAMAKPAQRLKMLMKFRNSYPAFGGVMTLLACDDHHLAIRWDDGKYSTELYADLNSYEFEIRYRNEGGIDTYLQI